MPLLIQVQSCVLSVAVPSKTHRLSFESLDCSCLTFSRCDSARVVFHFFSATFANLTCLLMISRSANA